MSPKTIVTENPIIANLIAIWPTQNSHSIDRGAAVDPLRNQPIVFQGDALGKTGRWLRRDQ